MADAVTVNVISNTDKYYTVHLTNVSDGTGESAVVKVDKSTLTDINEREPMSLNIATIRWAMQGFSSIQVLWDHTTDDKALVLSGSGYDDFVNGGIGGHVMPSGLPDPRSAGGTGDILLTTVGASATATYDITLTLRKMEI